jgi:hypothetical protein
MYLSDNGKARNTHELEIFLPISLSIPTSLVEHLLPIRARESQLILREYFSHEEEYSTILLLHNGRRENENIIASQRKSTIHI